MPYMWRIPDMSRALFEWEQWNAVKTVFVYISEWYFYKNDINLLVTKVDN